MADWKTMPRTRALVGPYRGPCSECGEPTYFHRDHIEGRRLVCWPCAGGVQVKAKRPGRADEQRDRLVERLWGEGVSVARIAARTKMGVGGVNSAIARLRGREGHDMPHRGRSKPPESEA